MRPQLRLFPRKVWGPEPPQPIQISAHPIPVETPHKPLEQQRLFRFDPVPQKGTFWGMAYCGYETANYLRHKMSALGIVPRIAVSPPSYSRPLRITGTFISQAERPAVQLQDIQVLNFLLHCRF